MNSAFLSEVRGQMPAMTGMRKVSIRRRKSSRTCMSKTGWVIANSAPASTFMAKRRTSKSRSWTPGLAATAMVKPVDPRWRSGRCRGRG